MEKSENPNLISADKPLNDPKDDQLSYASFAKQLAESIVTMVPPAGLVISIYGYWGLGKTTVLNFIEYYLSLEDKTEQPVLIKFNPWWFSGHEDLTRKFFDQLSAVLSKRKVLSKKLIKKINTLGQVVSEIPRYGFLGKILVLLTGEKPKDVTAIKEEVKKLISDQKRKLLVVIDDVDRLTSEEIRQLFRVIKAIGDLPNVVYLLALDKKVAIEALKQEQGVSGEEYLEKIVQVPFELPLPNKTSLNKLFFKKLDVILEGTPQELFDKKRWSDAFYDGIDQFIRTPRDIVRFANTMSVTYAAVKGEVNPIDFVAVEVLRVFCPTAYNIIRNHIDAFADPIGDPFFLRLSDEEFSRFHNSWIEELPDTEKRNTKQIKDLLLLLFPRLGRAWVGPSYGGEPDPSSRRHLRICHPEIFPVYFRLSIPEEGISTAEMKAFLGLTNEREKFASKLVEISNQPSSTGGTRIPIFLERCRDFTEDWIPMEHIPNIIDAFFNVGDKLLRPEDLGGGWFYISTVDRINQIILQLLSRLRSPADRYLVLSHAITRGKSVSTIVREVSILGAQHGKYKAEALPEGRRLIDAAHLESLEKKALDKIRDAVQEGTLFSSPNLAHTLYRYRDWADSGEVKLWIDRSTRRGQELADLLVQFISSTHIEGGDGTKIHEYIDPKTLEPFFDIPSLFSIVGGLRGSPDFTDQQKKAIDLFINGYQLRAQGKDPSNLFPE